jgi:hypothetical protein
MELFEQMQREGMIRNGFTFVLVLTASASLQVLEEGRCITSHDGLCSCSDYW